jgi:DNA-binding MarR family transcriptional regulator
VTAEGDLGMIQQALERLLRLSASRRVQAKQAAAAGVTLSQPAVVVLRRIDEAGRASLGELARLAEMDAAATGRQVRALEAEGYVSRRASPEDGRVTIVELTPRGASVLGRIAAVLEGHMVDVLGGWSPSDRHRLAVLLTRLVGDLRSVNYRAAADGRPA